ncbi:ImcF-related family protein [Xenorhabdus szentirmaii]|uniref:ImcF-related family protein n=1 Tax=Xenorhabdus szentirmaii TaxID=290112 RepID=UPI002B404976|nr:ImcF-related family protein [Xenorhabdus sp. 38]
MPESKSKSGKSVYFLMIVYTLVIAVFVVVGAFVYYLISEQELPIKQLLIQAGSVFGILLLFFPFFVLAWSKHAEVSFTLLSGRAKTKKKSESQQTSELSVTLKQVLKRQYGRSWKKKVQILMLTGSADHIEQLVPGLISEQWLEADSTLLFWGGDVTTPPDETLFHTLRKLRRSQPLDGIVWVTGQYHQSVRMDAPVHSQPVSPQMMEMLTRNLSKRFQTLGWQVPVYVWSLHQTQWDNADEQTQAAGCLLPAVCSSEKLQTALDKLVPTIVEQGTQHVANNSRHDFLLSLGSFLRHGGGEKISASLSAFFNTHQPLPLAGLMFSLPATDGLRADLHHWSKDARWDHLLNSVRQLPPGLKPVHLGWQWKKTGNWILALLMLGTGAGMLISYVNNRLLIEEGGLHLAQAKDQNALMIKRLQAWQGLQEMLSKLQYRKTYSLPFYARMGLNQNETVLKALWPAYTQYVMPWLRDSIDARMEKKLSHLVNLPPNSAARSEAAKDAYGSLKVYLMMGRPENIDANFFRDSVMANWPSVPNVPKTVWQARGPELLTFYAENLSAHPEWVKKPDEELIRQSRTVLVREIGHRNGESSLYQKLLQQVANHYSDMTLANMTGETDADLLFTADSHVPGMFTRKAWEESVEPAIERLANERRTEIDWVLSDGQQNASDDVSPEVLKAKLTDRYFADFSGAWLNFLNGLHWRRADTLSDTIDQLTLMADVRQSPLIGLMNTLAYQGKTGRKEVSESFAQSAKSIFNKDKQPAISQKVGFTGPLEPTFGPLLELIEPKAGAQDGQHLSLYSFLTRVTRVRLKLQQVTNSADPQAMSQTMAQTIFQGKALDLSDTRDYGNLVAASLGQEWSGFGQTVFVSPMEQAWQQLLAPTAESLNAQWKRAIVDDWNLTFGGRYPFKASDSEASLPLLSQYLRADSGRIHRFLESRLSGVLRREGNHWVPDSINAQGLNFNPEFLKALNTLNVLSDVVFANGEARLYFDLRPDTAQDVMQTNLVIDNQKLIYMNQRPEWTRFVWPNDTRAQGAMLSWVSSQASTRIYAEQPGSWGLIRLLEKANVTPWAGSDSSYYISWRAPDGLILSYTLRTEAGAGPLALLKLRNFVLPTKIFLEK